jgi:N-acetylneuraminic acid mutarotase
LELNCVTTQLITTRVGITTSDQYSSGARFDLTALNKRSLHAPLREGTAVHHCSTHLLLFRRTVHLRASDVLALLFCVASPAPAPTVWANDVMRGQSDCADDTWTATDTTGAPNARAYHTAVWTGSELIVWGGYDGSSLFNTGGQYDPVTDTWIATSTTDAPSARVSHTAVWTDSEMIVWGGESCCPLTRFNTGGLYDPVMDTWTALNTSGAPSARPLHTAVWTGSEMIVWGGGEDTGEENTGGRYSPADDSWVATSVFGAPRTGHTAVWTGTEMIVWGGRFCTAIDPELGGCSDYFYLNTGGRYNPVTNSWLATSVANAPTARSDHTAVWTGREMIIWGGGGASSTFNTGGRYDPATNSWTAITSQAPEVGTAVWTGGEMIIWGGWPSATGARYDPATDTWAASSTIEAPSSRWMHTAVWTGTQMIIWGGLVFLPTSYLNTGGRYCATSLLD